MANKYPDSGALFANEGKTGKQPDYNGKISLSKETIDSLSEIARSQGDATIYISGWTKISASGKRFMSLKASPPLGGRSGGGDDFMAPKPEKPRYDIGDDEIPF